MKKRQPIERIEASCDRGLSNSDVAKRIATGNTNYIKRSVGKSYLAIFATNILTLFNLIGIIVMILMVLCNSTENMLFFVIILANTVIGIFQEVRSKRQVEKMALVQQPIVTAIRDGKQCDIGTNSIVLDDIVYYDTGRQICADSIVVEGEISVNESMLTGESIAVKKVVGDTLYSGSFVVSGNCYSRCDKVGEDSYIQQLSAKVKKFVKPNSQLMKSITAIVKVISIIILPLGIATFFTGGYDLSTAEGIRQSILAASGSVIGMVPSGMVLLTSMALAVSVIKLLRKKVLVQELYCIEMLARVDTLCLDKTGTITDGTMTVEQVISYDDTLDIASIIGSIVVATGDRNSTADAVARYSANSTVIDSIANIPFSSATKFSCAQFADIGTVAMGAGEFLLAGKAKEEVAKLSQQYLAKGMRVLTVAKSRDSIEGDTVGNFQLVGLVIISDTVRSDAGEIISWFVDNSVDIKVISGDNPIAVSAIAAKVGVAGAENYISLEGMSDDEVIDSATKYSVFGRVSPEQKALLVTALKHSGRTVAMTGDGVNDILAMRQSDCGITVASGSDATKSVAHLILLDNNFGSMPSVVAEGRQVVNNIQNSSSLFLMKTTMTILTTIMLLFMVNTSYPFQPQNLYAIELFVIGIPSFLLALKPNRSLIKGSFLKSTLSRTLPSGFMMFLSIAVTYMFSGVLGLSADQCSTVAMFSMTLVGLMSLWLIARPYNLINIGIGAIGTVGTIACFVALPSLLDWITVLLGGTASGNTMYVDISTTSILFVVANVIVMTALVVLSQYVIKLYNNKKENILCKN